MFKSLFFGVITLDSTAFLGVSRLKEPTADTGTMCCPRQRQPGPSNDSTLFVNSGSLGIIEMVRMGDISGTERQKFHLSSLI